MPPPGRVAFSSQSGALGLAVLERGQERELGLSSFASIGNRADITGNDFLEKPFRDQALLDTVHGRDVEIVAAFESAVADGMNVINFSGGGDPRRGGAVVAV